MAINLKDKVIVITGSTGGLGSGVAEACLAQGAKLALMDIDAGRVTTQASALGAQDEVRAWQVDVRDMQSIETAMNEAAEHFGRLDIVFANAGITAFAPMESMQPEVFERVIDTDGVSLVDFGTGADAYKRDWMEANRPRYRLDCLDWRQPRAWPAIARAWVRHLAPHNRPS